MFHLIGFAEIGGEAEVAERQILHPPGAAYRRCHRNQTLAAQNRKQRQSAVVGGPPPGEFFARLFNESIEVAAITVECGHAGPYTGPRGAVNGYPRFGEGAQCPNLRERPGAAPAEHEIVCRPGDDAREAREIRSIT